MTMSLLGSNFCRVIWWNTMNNSSDKLHELIYNLYKIKLTLLQ